jgi:hypothetical protein
MSSAQKSGPAAAGLLLALRLSHQPNESITRSIAQAIGGCRERLPHTRGQVIGLNITIMSPSWIVDAVIPFC